MLIIIWLDMGVLENMTLVLDVYLTKLGKYRFYIWDIYCELAMGFLEKYDLDLYSMLQNWEIGII